MRSTAFFLILIPTLLFFSCNSADENSEETLTATINGESWEFFLIELNRNGEDLEITASGYLEGDRGAVPVNLEMTIVSLPEKGEIETPYTSYFAPNTTGTAVYATIEPDNSQLEYDTQLDPNATGELTITEADESTISGEFNFIATDKSGRKLEVTDGKFNDLNY